MIGKFSLSLYVGSKMEYLSIFVISESTVAAAMLSNVKVMSNQNNTTHSPQIP